MVGFHRSFLSGLTAFFEKLTKSDRDFVSSTFILGMMALLSDE